MFDLRITQTVRRNADVDGGLFALLRGHDRFAVPGVLAVSSPLSLMKAKSCTRRAGNSGSAFGSVSKTDH